jgi:hypothetical protein
MPAEVATIDVAELRGLLDRIAPLIAPADHATLTMLLNTHLGLLRELRESTATIARLRRLAGIESSEKTRVVLSRNKGSQNGSGPEGPSASEGDGSGVGSAPLGADPLITSSEGHRPGGDEAAAEGGPVTPPPPSSPPAPEPPPEEAEKTPEGHGRLGVSDYPDARHCPIPHESLRLGQSCPLCGKGKLYALEPAHWVRITGQPPLVAECTCLEQLRCSACGRSFTAKAPSEIATVGRIDVMAVAVIAHLRYLGGMPHHHLEHIQANLRTPLPASTQWEAVAEGFETIRPVLEELRREAAQGDVFFIDDTRGPVLEFMGKRRAALVKKGELPHPDRTGLFTTGVVSRRFLGHDVALFMTGRPHAGENLAEVLQCRDPGLELPILMADALASNTALGCAVVEAHCIAHARRYWVDQLQNHPQECTYFLTRLAVVFKVDAQSHADRLSAEQRLAVHQEHSQPVMDELKAWMERQFQQRLVEPNSGLGHAINYMLKRWETFTVFLRVPGAPLENNAAERALKAAIRHRRNSLFYRNARGARVGDGYMSVLYTAELCGENSFAYLVELLRHPDAVAQSPRDWLPWTYRATLARMAGGGPGDPSCARAGPLCAREGKRLAA